MKIWESLMLVFLYLTIAAYGLLAPYLIVHGIVKLSEKDERDMRSSIRPVHSSRTASEHGAALRKRGWANRWLPRNIELNVPAARTPGRKLAG